MSQKQRPGSGSGTTAMRTEPRPSQGRSGRAAEPEPAAACDSGGPEEEEEEGEEEEEDGEGWITNDDDDDEVEEDEIDRIGAAADASDSIIAGGGCDGDDDDDDEEGATLIEECLSRERAGQIMGQVSLRTDGAGIVHDEGRLEDAGSCCVEEINKVHI